MAGAGRRSLLFGLIDILVLGLQLAPGDATFAFSQPFAKVTVPNLSLPAAVTCYVCGGITIAIAVGARPFRAVRQVGCGGWPSPWSCFLFIVALLCWADAGQTTRSTS